MYLLALVYPASWSKAPQAMVVTVKAIGNPNLTKSPAAEILEVSDGRFLGLVKPKIIRIMNIISPDLIIHVDSKDKINIFFRNTEPLTTHTHFDKIFKYLFL